MRTEQINISIEKPLALELDKILSQDTLDYDTLNETLDYYIVEYDSLLESRIILFSDLCVMSISVYVEDNKAHIGYWLTSPSGEEIEGTTVTTIIRSFSISYQENLYIVEITVED
ncbi:hypothetical protein P4603_04910 [Priestia aryabhattai]|nr:hypothetical protein [Priestia aryabhattai]